MEDGNGKWRYTSPTHTVRAFMQAMLELEEEGGIEKRNQRYLENHRILVEGIAALGIECLLPMSYQSPIITSFRSPLSSEYDFNKFYEALKTKGFVIYPGKVSVADTFRIGNIGHVFPEDFRNLIKSIEEVVFW